MAIITSNGSTQRQTGRNLFGRRVIYTSEKAITAQNVCDVVEQAYITHLINRDEIQYLWDYYKGNQPVLYRKREIRDELTQRICENRANSIVSFKVGYLVGKPIQYVSSVSGDSVSQNIGVLNDKMRIRLSGRRLVALAIGMLSRTMTDLSVARSTCTRLIPGTRSLSGQMTTRRGFWLLSTM